MGSEDRERLAEEKADRFAELQRYAFIAGFMDGGETGTDAPAKNTTLEERYVIMERGIASIMTTIMPFLPPSNSSAGWYAPAAVECAVATLKGQVQAAVKHGEMQVSAAADRLVSAQHECEVMGDKARRLLMHIEPNVESGNVFDLLYHYSVRNMERIAELEKSRDASNAKWDEAWQILVKLPGTLPEGDFVTEFRKTVMRFQDWRDELRAKWEARGFEFLQRFCVDIDSSLDFFDAFDSVIKKTGKILGKYQDSDGVLRQEAMGLRNDIQLARAEIESLQRTIALKQEASKAHQNAINALHLELDERNKEVACLKQDLRQSDKDLKAFVAKAEEKQQEVLSLRDILDDSKAANARIRMLCKRLADVENQNESAEYVVEQALKSLLKTKKTGNLAHA